MKQLFKNYLAENLTFKQLVELWNTYGTEHYPDGHIFDGVEEFCDLYEPEATSVARMVFFGDIQNWGDLVYLDGYGNFKSCWDLDSSPIDLEVLADAMAEDYHEIYKAWEEEQEEEQEEE